MKLTLRDQIGSTRGSNLRRLDPSLPGYASKTQPLLVGVLWFRSKA